MACSALVPPPLICPNWGPSSRNLTSSMTEPLASTLPTPGKWHIKSHGMETWHCLPLAIAVSYAKHTFYFTLSLRNGVVPPSNVHQLEASAFEWKGALPNHPSATISFARDGLVLQAQFPMVLFPFPAGRGSTSISSSQPTGYTLRPVSGTYFFANASFNKGHTHPLSSGLHDPDDIPLPPQMIRWPQDSPSVLPVTLATPRNEIQFHLGYPQTVRPSTSKASKPSLLRTPYTMPIPRTGFQPIAHMLSTISPKNIYLSWLTRTLWPPLIQK